MHVKFVFVGQKVLMDKNNGPSPNTGTAERDAGWGARDAVLSLESCSDGGLVLVDCSWEDGQQASGHRHWG